MLHRFLMSQAAAEGARPLTAAAVADAPATRRKLRREILFSCIISSLFCFGAQISKALRAPSIKL
ncbi:hypothetical protein C4N25_11475 [Faecalibacterium prausnitzii]|uniref:Uncharacterized protein n=1 Tax=Faecalibacterium prausnitzii TaxID=853 RepID=A0A329TG53_9FIRM|nr:hypothetical protein C4N25_11475 [Faecalibacterium prausnitzii]